MPESAPGYARRPEEAQCYNCVALRPGEVPATWGRASIEINMVPQRSLRDPSSPSTLLILLQGQPGPYTHRRRQVTARIPDLTRGRVIHILLRIPLIPHRRPAIQIPIIHLLHIRLLATRLQATHPLTIRRGTLQLDSLRSLMLISHIPHNYILRRHIRILLRPRAHLAYTAFHLIHRPYRGPWLHTLCPLLQPRRTCRLLTHTVPSNPIVHHTRNRFHTGHNYPETRHLRTHPSTLRRFLLIAPPPAYIPPPGQGSGRSPDLPTGPSPRQRHNPSSATPSALQSRNLPSSLPPKPPRNRREQPEPQHDNRNKRRHDRHNRHRDNRQKKTSSNSHTPDQKGQERNRRAGAKTQNGSKDMQLPGNKDLKAQEALPLPISGISASPTGESGKPDTHGIPVDTPLKSEDASAEPVAEQSLENHADDSELEEDVGLAEPEAERPPDEVGKPLPASYNEEVLLPRKWDAICVESEFVKADNLEDFSKPVHEKTYWPLIEFDPAFVLDGKLPCGDPLPKSWNLEDRNGGSNASNNGESNTQPRKREMSDEEEVEERQGKRRRSNTNSLASLQNSISGNAVNNPTPSRHSTAQNSPLRLETHERAADSPTDGRRKISEPKESIEPRQNRSRTPASRRSSVSSTSSSLNSLEAELLGLPSKENTPDDAEKRQRQPISSSPAIKKRQPKLDSAYSRRW
ncbi:hypothetical protein G7046_g4523 [Stylonectria norvegica]|nr:hypothetical protein G7046_g4523 [Stylonectria norvegica]